MTPEEIRGRLTSSTSEAFFLREIAAQQAENNELVREVLKCWHESIAIQKASLYIPYLAELSTATAGNVGITLADKETT